MCFPTRTITSKLGGANSYDFFQIWNNTFWRQSRTRFAGTFENASLCCFHARNLSTLIELRSISALIMKLNTPEIAWHGKEPVLSVDFCKVGSKWRLASGGADNDVKVGYRSVIENLRK